MAKQCLMQSKAIYQPTVKTGTLIPFWSWRDNGTEKNNSGRSKWLLHCFCLFHHRPSARPEAMRIFLEHLVFLCILHRRKAWTHLFWVERGDVKLNRKTLKEKTGVTYSLSAGWVHMLQDLSIISLQAIGLDLDLQRRGRGCGRQLKGCLNLSETFSSKQQTAGAN